MRGNSFAELEIEEVPDSVVDNVVSGYPDSVKPKKAKSVQRRCTQCGAIHKSSSEFCPNCSDDVIDKLSNFDVERSV